MIYSRQSVKVIANIKKKPRDRMDRRAKKLAGCDQPKELFTSLAAGDDGVRLPAATEGFVDRDNPAIQIHFGLGL